MAYLSLAFLILFLQPSKLQSLSFMTNLRFIWPLLLDLETCHKTKHTSLLQMIILVATTAFPVSLKLLYAKRSLRRRLKSSYIASLTSVSSSSSQLVLPFVCGSILTVIYMYIYISISHLLLSLHIAFQNSNSSQGAFQFGTKNPMFEVFTLLKERQCN